MHRTPAAGKHGLEHPIPEHTLSRMGVQNPRGKRGQRARPQTFHVASQEDDVRARSLQRVTNRGIEGPCLSAAIYIYTNTITRLGTGSSVAEQRAGDLMPATALQTFKAQFFRALSHPVRIKILEILIAGDRSVQELQEALKLDQPVVSQQLAVLRNQGIVTSEKKGLSVRYALRDPAIEDLLDVARRIFNNHLVNTRGMLRELQREGRRV